MLLNRILPLAALALLMAVPAARGQDAAPLKIGVCNPAKVFDGMDERNVIQNKMKADREKLQTEAATKKRELDELKAQRQNLKPDTAVYNEVNQQLMQKAVDFEVWVRLMEADMQRKEKEQVKALYYKIQEATKEVATQKGLDLVLAEHTPQIPEDMTNMTPDQLRQLISTNDVLFKNDKADITQAVIVAVNNKYSAGKGGNK